MNKDKVGVATTVKQKSKLHIERVSGNCFALFIGDNLYCIAYDRSTLEDMIKVELSEYVG